jgi:hypothetical protein
LSQRAFGTKLLTLVVNAIGRPVVHVWLHTAEMSDPLLPRPEAPDRRQPPAHNDDRVLLVGNGATVGYGVLSHDLSLAGHLGRQISQVTGRSTHVSVIADGTMTAGSAVAALVGVDLEPYDGIVVTIGVNETLSLSSLERWRRELDRLLRFVRGRAPRLRVFLVAIPPVNSITEAPAFVDWITDRHARTLNQAMSEACARFARVTFLPFAPDASSDEGRYRSTETYRQWSALLSGDIAEWLLTDCAEDD